MKKIIYLLVGIFVFTACNDDYLDILPYGKTIPENADDLARMLNHTNTITNGGTNWMYMSDDLGIPKDRENSTSVTTKNQYTWSDFVYTENQQDGDWEVYYKTISLVNYVLKNIDVFEEGDEFDKKTTIGRAHFYRANAYFHLLTCYATNYDANTAASDLGVPMPLKMDINVTLPRVSVKEINDLIHKDLKLAIENLPEKSKHTTWAGKQSAYALLGRLYLHEGNYAQSAKYSKMAMDISKELYDYNTFKMYRGRIVGWDYNSITNIENIFHSKRLGHYPGLILSDKLIASFDQAKDLRFKNFVMNFMGNYIPFAEGNMPWIGIRMAEIYLNYCEALMRQDDTEGEKAVIVLNELRVKRYDAATYTPFNHTDDATTLAEIMLERQRELRLTVVRWYDMKRLGLTHTRTFDGKTYTINGDSKNYVMAIPKNVIAMNPLKQNPRGL